jgi:hypothetical protein
MSCSFVCIGGTCFLHLHGREVSHGKVAWTQEKETAELEVRSRPNETEALVWAVSTRTKTGKMAVSEQ